MLTKSAATLAEARQIADAIYKENPDNWPYGIPVEQLDDLSIIRTKSASAAGFVGWQHAREPDGSVTGYYSIGVLPEYRGQGFAKEAIAKSLLMKSATVDQVKAFIVPGNTPSEKLASSLGVPVMREGTIKLASAGSKLLELAKRLAHPTLVRGAAGAAASVPVTYAENEFFGVPQDALLAKGNYVGNALMGASMGAHPTKMKAGVYAGVLGTKTPALSLGEEALATYRKDAPLRHETATKELEAAKSRADAANTEAATAGTMKPDTKAALALAGLLGSGALGMYAYNSLKSKKPARATSTETIHGNDGPVRKKVTINIPAKALPPEFYQSLINADDRRGANMTLTSERP